MVWKSTEEKLTEKLNEEKGYIWSEINKLQETIKGLESLVSKLNKSAPEHFTKTVGARNKVSQIKNQAQTSFEQLQEICNSAEDGNELLATLKESAQQNSQLIQQYFEQARDSLEELNETKDIYTSTKEDADLAISQLNDLLEEKNTLSVRIDSISAQVETSEQLTNKLKTLLSSATNERKGISELYQEIFGYTYEDDQGEEQVVDGLQKHLESSYSKIKDDLGQLSSEVALTRKHQEEALIAIAEAYEKKAKGFLSSAEKQRAATFEKINSLLPAALTAGLSCAYADKIAVEKVQLDKHDKAFYLAIIGLIVCSSLPVIFTMIRVLYLQESFSLVIKDMPTIFSVMLPVYAPILWVAYSSNKSYKLSKRLIEEYTHKEVSSRTFEGLSTQISNIGEDDTSGELRTRLLFNLLQVNSENPGKLISDYNNSDHPILDAIDKSSKFTDALGKLENVPVLSQLLNHLNAREKAKLEAQAKSVVTTMETQLADNDSEEKEQAKAS
ncbi:hypothetical protein [Vibrio harveyi]|uniref:hypothetical protein n=1 Tax=Vibrio harveyi TaxID=669 RepID=UPI0006944A22|nr:hypothetical protein [Vibrio harveyi]